MKQTMEDFNWGETKTDNKDFSSDFSFGGAIFGNEKEQKEETPNAFLPGGKPEDKKDFIVFEDSKGNEFKWGEQSQTTPENQPNTEGVDPTSESKSHDKIQPIQAVPGPFNTNLPNQFEVKEPGKTNVDVDKEMSKQSEQFANLDIQGPFSSEFNMGKKTFVDGFPKDVKSIKADSTSSQKWQPPRKKVKARAERSKTPPKKKAAKKKKKIIDEETNVELFKDEVNPIDDLDLTLETLPQAQEGSFTFGGGSKIRSRKEAARQGLKKDFSGIVPYSYEEEDENEEMEFGVAVGNPEVFNVDEMNLNTPITPFRRGNAIFESSYGGVKMWRKPGTPNDRSLNRRKKIISNEELLFRATRRRDLNKVKEIIREKDTPITPLMLNTCLFEPYRSIQIFEHFLKVLNKRIFELLRENPHLLKKIVKWDQALQKIEEHYPEDWGKMGVTYM